MSSFPAPHPRCHGTLDSQRPAVFHLNQVEHRTCAGARDVERVRQPAKGFGERGESLTGDVREHAQRLGRGVEFGWEGNEILAGQIVDPGWWISHRIMVRSDQGASLVDVRIIPYGEMPPVADGVSRDFRQIGNGVHENRVVRAYR